MLTVFCTIHNFTQYHYQMTIFDKLVIEMDLERVFLFCCVKGSLVLNMYVTLSVCVVCAVIFNTVGA